MLTEAGYRQRTDLKDLVLLDEANKVEFYYLRPRDIAVYVGKGTLDLGDTDRDMLLDSGADAEIMTLGFGGSKFRFAAPARSNATPPGRPVRQAGGHQLSRPAEPLPDRARRRSPARSTDGAVESSIRLGVADAIADVVETGTTLKKAGLELFGDPILQSEGILIRRPASGGRWTRSHWTTCCNACLVCWWRVTTC